jgi:hypothetical protein
LYIQITKATFLFCKDNKKNSFGVRNIIFFFSWFVVMFIWLKKSLRRYDKELKIENEGKIF